MNKDLKRAGIALLYFTVLAEHNCNFILLILFIISEMFLAKLLLILLSAISTRTEHPSAPPVLIWGKKL